VSLRYRDADEVEGLPLVLACSAGMAR